MVLDSSRVLDLPALALPPLRLTALGALEASTDSSVVATGAASTVAEMRKAQVRMTRNAVLLFFIQLC